MALRLDDFSFNTVVGDGSFVKGDLRVNGSVRIDGSIDGNLESDGNANIGENAKIRGNVSASSAIVAGIVLGNIVVKEKIILLSSSSVIGDVIARHVQIEDGVVFHGKCISVSDEEKFAQESDQYLQEQAIRLKAKIVL